MSVETFFALLIALIRIVDATPELPNGTTTDLPESPVQVTCEVDVAKSGTIVAYAAADAAVAGEYRIDLAATGDNDIRLKQGASFELGAGERKQLKEIRLGGDFTSVSGELLISWKGGETTCKLG